MKTIIYTRVSTDNQSHESQRESLQQYCQQRGWGNVEEITDTISGSKFTRTGLDRLMAGVRSGKVKVIVCFKLDRLGRSLAHLAQIISELKVHQVALVVPSQGIDTSNSNPAAQLQLNILSCVAEFEREIIKERVNAGLEAAKRRGVKLGRPSTLDAHEGSVSELLKQGIGVCGISRELKIPLSSASKLVKRLRGNQFSSSKSGSESELILKTN